ncbi:MULTISPECIES: FtsB family cell division protein [Paenibacillus]|uniref:Septum formation initiator family protein n=1 Tax=Paenibacillus lignilyticus TaxID=1172615 RepID=A0ABS5CMZ1_9BACL|nr:MULTISPECIES: septum formation initiator family protein [Paenibacillus]MBP3967228.1 septum formation initiator family protein [Paenibacillus lignilyticus]SDX84622.1 cell division protein DivIC [Paenibacillus sp. CF384]SFT28494.1 cell division protein DivIC [Paenibacillus sp. BC26]
MATTTTSSHSSAAAQYAGTKRRLKIWVVFIVLFMGWALYTLISQLDRQGQAEIKLANASQKIDAAAKQVEELKLAVARLSDKEYIGQLATKEQGMVRKGEKRIEVVTQP